MSSFTSYFGKKHKYETLADLIKVASTPEAIIRTDPKDIRTDILDKPIVPPLSEEQKKALRMLLAIKRQEKKSGENLEAREKVITQFLGNEPQVNALLVETTSEVLKEQIEQKDLENRLRALRDEPIVPYTEEEELYKRQLELRKGGKRTRKHNKKGSRKHKKKSLRKNTKRATRKNKKRKY
jgi:hypothetical protein